MLLIDDETRTYWDHVTGEAVHGELTGNQLDAWSVQMTTVEAALIDYPDLRLHRSNFRSFRSRLMSRLHRKKINKRGFIPPPFYLTMGKLDERLEKNIQGLGVMVDGVAKFYPIDQLTGGVLDSWGAS